MAKMSRDSLLSLEDYAKARNAFRAKVMQHKKSRKVALGEHITLTFEDELTVRYQVQEMLRVEKIFEEAGIQDELDTYNPLIPDGGNWKATMMIEYTDADERKRMLGRLIGVEDRVWVRVNGLEKVFPVADEDLERETREKTSSVHFLRFELNRGMVHALQQGAELQMGVDHPAYRVILDVVAPEVRESLAKDLVAG
jgi:hypothetical protein